MFNVKFSPAQRRVETDLKELAAGSLRAFAREADETGEIPAGVRSALAAFGLPGADGFASGVDDPVAFCLAAESLAWADPAIAYAWLASRQVAWIIASCATEAQKGKWLPRFASDPFLPASLYLYEGRGIAPSEVETQVRRSGQGFSVNGFKSPVMYPAAAVVSVVIGRDASGALAGLLIEDLGGAVEFRGAGRGRKLAMNACPTAVEARFWDLQAPADSALATEDLQRALTICRLAHACVCIGTAAAATRFAGEWGQKRIAFGKPLVGFQGVSFPLVNLVLEADAARLSVLHLATATLMGPEELERGTNEVVAHANQLLADAGREGVQMMGVHGVLQEHPQERFYRSAAMLASIDFDPLTCGFVVR